MSELAGSTTSTAPTPTPGAPGAPGAPRAPREGSGDGSQRAAGAPVHQVRVLLFSDDRATRDRVMRAVGRKPARDVEVVDWEQFATHTMAAQAVKDRPFDVLILDGESAPLGGMGLCRQLKTEVFDCPPVVLLTARADDAWLAAWSYAERSVPHPLDPMVLANAVADVVRNKAERVNQATGKVGR